MKCSMLLGTYKRQTFKNGTNERNERMFKSNRTNQLLKIVGIWTIYLLVFTTSTSPLAQDKTFFILTTAFYILTTIFFLWRIKNPSKNMRTEE